MKLKLTSKKSLGTKICTAINQLICKTKSAISHRDTEALKSITTQFPESALWKKCRIERLLSSCNLPYLSWSEWIHFNYYYYARKQCKLISYTLYHIPYLIWLKFCKQHPETITYPGNFSGNRESQEKWEQKYIFVNYETKK